MNYYHETTHIRPRVFCADGVSLSIQASEYNYCSPRQRLQKPWNAYSLVEVGYIYDKDNQPFSPPDVWREYQDGQCQVWGYVPVQVWLYVPVSVVEEFIEAHGGEVAAPPAPWVEQIIE